MPAATLTSLSNPTVKHLVRMRDNRARRKAGRILVDGWRETRCALDAELAVAGVYFVADPSLAASPEETFVRQNAAEYATIVSPAVMQKISYGQSERGVVAEFELPNWGIEQLSIPESPLILVLDGIEKPGNLGAAFRCADAVGAHAVIMTPQQSDRFNPNAIRSSLGAVFTVPSAVTDEATAKRWLVERNINLFAARVESSTPMWETDFGCATAIIIGSESDGLGERWQSDSGATVAGTHLPMSGSIDSLNASVSAALMLYEAKRQRRADK